MTTPWPPAPTGCSRWGWGGSRPIRPGSRHRGRSGEQPAHPVNVSFALRLAAREGRATLRGVGVHALSISLGVAALVAVQGVRSDVAHAIDHQAQVLLGADARLESDRPFPPPVEALIDSLARGGVEGARI